MNIYLQDLGPLACARILQVRMAQNGLVPPEKIGRVLSGIEVIPTPPMPMSFAQIVRPAALTGWIWGIAGIVFAVTVTIFLSWNFLGGIGLGAFFGLNGGILGFFSSFGKRSNVYRREINIQEVILAEKSSHEPLTTEYLAIAKTLIEMPPPSDVFVEQNIRKALHSLGAAIESLPPQATEHITADAAILKQEAHQLAKKASGETDTVVAASLTRQAEALTRRAETVARTATLVRRNQILRDEVAAQVKAFQTSLAAAQINGGQVGGDFDALAESVAQVAQEANALAEAQEELEVALNPARAISQQGTLLTQTTRR
jgi:hypothetical protein